jgi:hypothetical protein
MNIQEARVLLRVAEALEKAAQQLRELVGDLEVASPKRESTDVPNTVIERFSMSDRATVEAELGNLSHKQLGAVFAKLGGSSRERKRSKEWLVGRILWYLFDFREGHEIIRR